MKEEIIVDECNNYNTLAFSIIGSIMEGPNTETLSPIVKQVCKLSVCMPNMVAASSEIKFTVPLYQKYDCDLKTLFFLLGNAIFITTDEG